jgi:catechol 2,3-dioxygenase-like lactoylglutathione lyase family enzyme
MEPRISIITLGVTDLPRAIRFYRDGLGFPTKAKDDASIAFFETTGTRFGLYPLDKLAEDISPELPAERSAFSGITLSHNVRTRDEVASVLKQAEAAGGRIVKHAQDVFWGGHSGYFADPDGHHWEVAWNPYFPLAEDGTLLIR